MSSSIAQLVEQQNHNLCVRSSILRAAMTSMRGRVRVVEVYLADTETG